MTGARQQHDTGYFEYVKADTAEHPHKTGFVDKLTRWRLQCETSPAPTPCPKRSKQPSEMAHDCGEGGYRSLISSFNRCGNLRLKPKPCQAREEYSNETRTWSPREVPVHPRRYRNAREKQQCTAFSATVSPGADAKGMCLCCTSTLQYLTTLLPWHSGGRNSTCLRAARSSRLLRTAPSHPLRPF